jgi:hypothetical protein
VADKWTGIGRVWWRGGTDRCVQGVDRLAGRSVGWPTMVGAGGASGIHRYQDRIVCVRECARAQVGAGDHVGRIFCFVVYFYF